MKKQATPPTFEEALAELDQVVHALEEGRLTLEDSLATYEKGIKLIQQCEQQLRKAEKRILQLTGQNDEAKPVLEPFPEK